MTVPSSENKSLTRMLSFGMLRRVAFVRTDVSEKCNIFIIRVTITGVLGVRLLLVTANVVPSSPILVSLMMEALRSSETTVLTRIIRRTIPDDGILHSHRRENLKPYKSPTLLGYCSPRYLLPHDPSVLSGRSSHLLECAIIS
jgi:hypothetical protein